MKKIFVVFVMIFVMFGCSKSTVSENSVSNIKYSWNDIYQAKTITITESLISIGKYYTISIDGHKIGYVRGKPIKILGDVFTIYDMNDNEIISEKQEKRSFRLSINRLASVVKNGKIDGYIGEEKIKQLFNIFEIYHFFDKNKNEIGYNKFKLSLMKHFDYYDMDNNVEYEVQKVFNVVDEYKIIVHNNDNIPVEYAIFMVCISDAIADSKEK